MSKLRDPLEYIFTSVGYDGNLKLLTPTELDEIRELLNKGIGGTNVVYCDNPKEPLILSTVYVNGDEIDSKSSEYDEKRKRLIISATPKNDSELFSEQKNLAQYCVGSMCDPNLKFFVPTYENGSSSFMALDGYPKNMQSFMGIVQADRL